MQQSFDDLEMYLERCIAEFKALEEILARAGEFNSLFSAVGKVALVFLGALVTTKEAVNQLVGSNNASNIVIFTLAGVFIAVIAGLEAAFKWEKSALELKGLAATCQKYLREAMYKHHKTRLIEDVGKKREDIENLIDIVNKDLDEIYAKSTELGINVSREVGHKIEKLLPISGKDKMEHVSKKNY